jgi:plasmid segregation protein ParM
LTEHYRARLLGAFNYMFPKLKRRQIDILVLGLPLNTYQHHHKALAELYTGKFKINPRGDTVTVRQCRVFPQPIGTYSMYMNDLRASGNNTEPYTLVVDPGFNTVDWLMVHKFKAFENTSGATVRGMSFILTEMANAIIKHVGGEPSTKSIARRIDAALATGADDPVINMYGSPIHLRELFEAGEAVANNVALQIKNAVGSSDMIDSIVVTGGGARLYARALKQGFPRIAHNVFEMPNPSMANVRGFFVMGHRLGQSAHRATGAHDGTNG